MTPRRGWIIRAITRPPFRDVQGRKGWFERFSRAQPHLVRRLQIEIAGWPRWDRPLRVAYLSDFHVGSHADDVVRLERIIAEAAAFSPDLALFGGDYVNMQLLGGGRVPPRVIAAALAKLPAPAGRFAVLGNHDIKYGGPEIATALCEQGLAVLDDEVSGFTFQGSTIALAGIPDGEVTRPAAAALLSSLPQVPTIVLAHDPVWFANVPAGPFLVLAGHTHGGQIKLPGVGVLTNASKAPLRWTYGHIVEDGRQMYVTSGLGSSTIPIRIGVPPEIVLLELTGRAR